MGETVKIISPIDGSVYAERAYASPAEVDATLSAAESAQKRWASTDIATRRQLIYAMLDVINRQTPAIAEELAWQMGRPVRYGAGEINGFN